MIEDYLSGSVRQSIERILQLRGIVQSRLPREYDGLRQICLCKLDQILVELSTLTRERIVDSGLQTPRRVRVFKRLVEQLNAVEGVGIFALNRVNDADTALNRLITEICTEIKYPLVNPVVSHMSQDYFHIYPDFNLLCLPLLESQFLLHMPDMYHELCHPLHRNLDLPILGPYALTFKKSLFGMVGYFQREALAADRLRNQEARLFQIQLWRTCWAKYWMEEFFCDLFGVLTVGPAYAWAHYHLCVRRGGDPFATPLMRETSHPADDARMRAMICMLRLAREFDTEADTIERAWRELIAVMGYRATAEYHLCYSDAQIEPLARAAREGVEGIGIVRATSGATARVRDALSEAWRVFWKSPTDFPAWEVAEVEKLLPHQA
ncbi:hypothetical protein SAMN02745126_06487 [Enhydrobacter aerosaccus]|uniref:Uncharacterized protein n=1 Tax=Enhydrobacter aerosaccus TaxID=225324 RepID=A0A1T4TLJ2_9HYPH|nr:hypothetical protein [Enhydrobacter aerosaccus]SKA41326.1 hypothetical protein SAMN02745126_06487 [Enhydrobacter aerosaccus]